MTSNENSKAAAISGYKRVLIQTPPASVGGQSTLYDTKTAWGMIAKTNPYPILPTPKECYKNDWKDEDGDDEYNAQMRYEAFTMDVSFYVKALATQTATAEAVLRSWMGDFFATIQQGEFMILDEYTGLGFQKVRYAGAEQGEFKSRNNWASLIIKVKFKVNDPVTRVGLVNGKLGII